MFHAGLKARLKKLEAKNAISGRIMCRVLLRNATGYRAAGYVGPNDALTGKFIVIPEMSDEEWETAVIEQQTLLLTVATSKHAAAEPVARARSMGKQQVQGSLSKWHGTRWTKGT